MKRTLLIFIIVIVANWSFSQNFGISDVEGHDPDPSAVLDVYSTTKGLLVPRMTTEQRLNIQNPSNGLLVYDTDLQTFCFYNASKGSWKLIATPDWQSNDLGYYTTGLTRMGIGTDSLNAKFTIQGDPTVGDDVPIFEVKNADGKTVFAVYNNGVRMYVDNDGAKNSPGGFAVGGVSSTKGTFEPYFVVYPDSTRVYFRQQAKNSPGGFAVGGVSSTKATPNYYFTVSPDSTRIYFNSLAKNSPGGFAVGGVSSTKGTPEYYLTVNRDSTRIYFNDLLKNSPGGFAVGGVSSTKATDKYLLSVTPSATEINFDDSDPTAVGFKVAGGYDYFSVSGLKTEVLYNATAKNSPGGFAVGGVSSTKGITNKAFIGDSISLFSDVHIAKKTVFAPIPVIVQDGMTLIPDNSIITLQTTYGVNISFNTSQPIAKGKYPGQTLIIQGPPAELNSSINLPADGEFISLSQPMIFSCPNDLIYLMWDGNNWIDITRTTGN